MSRYKHIIKEVRFWLAFRFLLVAQAIASYYTCRLHTSEPNVDLLVITIVMIRIYRA